MPNITIEDKLACVVRELKFRRRVYPRMVEQRKMQQGQADRELATMEAIAEDYRLSAALEDSEIELLGLKSLGGRL